MRKDKQLNIFFAIAGFYFFLTFISGCATVPRADLGMPVIHLQGRDYLPLLGLANKMSLSWDYEAVTHRVTLKRDGNEIKLLPGSHIVLVNNNPCDIKYQIEFYKGQVLAPLTFKNIVLDSLYPPTPAIKKEILLPRITYPVKLIVIDAGHGGNDPGAMGKQGLREKDVNMDIARRVRKILENQGMEVVMTRDSDRFITLHRRSDIANRKKADLFVSIHSNANPSRRLSGFEVYYLSEKIDDQVRAALAAENAVLDMDRSHFNDNSHALKTTLWDLIYTQNRAESIELARDICQVVSDQMGLRILGVKGAPFYVLKGTQMPAVLVEVGFISNLQEEQYMRNSYYRQQLADAISQGILNYCRNYQTMRARK